MPNTRTKLFFCLPKRWSRSFAPALGYDRQKIGSGVALTLQHYTEGDLFGVSERDLKPVPNYQIASSTDKVAFLNTKQFHSGQCCGSGSA